MMTNDLFEKKQKVISLGGSKYLVINLTEPLRKDVEVYPGDPKPKKKIFSEFTKSGYQHHIYLVGDHNFHPHGDAPNHQNPKQPGFEVYGLDFCFNNGCLIDLSNSAEAVEFDGINWLVEVRKDHIKPYTSLISTKNALLIRTGYDKWLEANKRHNKNHIPYLTKSTGKMLASFENLKVIGIDSLTIDAPGKNYVHQLFKDKLIVESLVNLYNIPKENMSNFDLQTSPVAIIGATGGPITAYAFIEIGEKNKK